MALIVFQHCNLHLVLKIIKRRCGLNISETAHQQSQTTKSKHPHLQQVKGKLQRQLTLASMSFERAEDPLKNKAREFLCKKREKISKVSFS